MIVKAMHILENIAHGNPLWVHAFL